MQDGSASGILPLTGSTKGGVEIGVFPEATFGDAMGFDKGLSLDAIFPGGQILEFPYNKSMDFISSVGEFVNRWNPMRDAYNSKFGGIKTGMPDKSIGTGKVTHEFQTIFRSKSQGR